LIALVSADIAAAEKNGFEKAVFAGVIRDGRGFMKIIDRITRGEAPKRPKNIPHVC